MAAVFFGFRGFLFVCFFFCLSCSGWLGSPCSLGSESEASSLSATLSPCTEIQGGAAHLDPGGRKDRMQHSLYPHCCIRSVDNPLRLSVVIQRLCSPTAWRLEASKDILGCVSSCPWSLPAPLPEAGPVIAF